MKRLLIALAILLSGVAWGQGPHLPKQDKPAIILKGELLFGAEEKTEIIITSEFDTIAHVERGIRYRFKLDADRIYNVTFKNGGQEKTIIIKSIHSYSKYHLKIAINWATGNENMLVRYNSQQGNYEFGEMNAGKE